MAGMNDASFYLFDWLRPPLGKWASSRMGRNFSLQVSNYQATGTHTFLTRSASSKSEHLLSIVNSIWALYSRTPLPPGLFEAGSLDAEVNVKMVFFNGIGMPLPMIMRGWELIKIL